MAIISVELEENDWQIIINNMAHTMVWSQANPLFQKMGPQLPQPKNVPQGNGIKPTNESESSISEMK